MDPSHDIAELKNQIQRLEEHYRRLVESISEDISVVTLDGVITSLNPAFESLTGWPTSRFIGSHMQSLIHPADLPLAIDRFQREMNGQRQPLAVVVIVTLYFISAEITKQLFCQWNARLESRR